MSAATIEGARPVPYKLTAEPEGVSFGNKQQVQAYLKKEWGLRLFTAHGATSAEEGGSPETYEFTSYHLLFLAYRKLGMPHTKSERSFNRHYLTSYLNGDVADFENFWEKYLNDLEARYEELTHRATLSAREQQMIKAWKREKDRDLTEEEEDAEKQQELERDSVLQYYSNAQGEWNEKAEKRREERGGNDE
ncbi:MAG: hypothetical protein Q9184_006906 [Pyrenodesmia sp. 2 TL-2023]